MSPEWGQSMKILILQASYEDEITMPRQEGISLQMGKSQRALFSVWRGAGTTGTQGRKTVGLRLEIPKCYMDRGHPDSNRGPLDLQSNALPLSYTP